VAGRWLPDSESELRDALKNGVLVESHFFDAKERLDPGEGGAKRLAVDLASFAVDGGTIAVGVLEDKERRAFELAPILLAGQAERVDQVARSRVDPPLPVGCREVSSDKGEGHGYLIVTIPASPYAPHMVDGKYRGRGDTTNRILNDAEIRRLHERAALTRDVARQLLREEVARDPAPRSDTPTGHMFVVAQPVAADPELLLRSVRPERLDQWVLSTVLSGAPCRTGGALFTPDLGTVANAISTRADGVALSSFEVGPGRLARANGDLGLDVRNMLDLEIREDGGLRLFCGRAATSAENGTRMAMEVIVAGLVYRVLLVAAEVVAATRYGGAWDLGLAVTQLHGCHSFALHSTGQILGRATAPYSADAYEQLVRVDSDSIVERPIEVVELLFGRLNRGLSGGRVAVPDLIGRLSE
jgi:hypothetical protein